MTDTHTDKTDRVESSTKATIKMGFCSNFCSDFFGTKTDTHTDKTDRVESSTKATIKMGFCSNFWVFVPIFVPIFLEQKPINPLK